MNRILRTATLCMAATALTACAQQNTVTRDSGTALTFHQDAKLSAAPAAQAYALNGQARQIVQRSTLRGAAIGAAVGCGVGVVASGGASKCLSHAVVGAAGGALIGNVGGRKNVAQRMRLAGSQELARDIRAADAQVMSLKSALPAHLAAQDAKLRRDKAALDAGTLSRAEFDMRLDAVRRDRTALAQALSLTAQQTRRASQNLTEAASKGQTGLDWHIKRTGAIADHAVSARSSISLL